MIGVVGFLETYAWLFNPVWTTWGWGCWTNWVVWPTWAACLLATKVGIDGLWGFMNDWGAAVVVDWRGKILFGLWTKMFWFNEDLSDCCPVGVMGPLVWFLMLEIDCEKLVTFD